MRRPNVMSVLTTVLLLGSSAAAFAQAKSDLLGPAASQAEREALETLSKKFESAGGQKIAPKQPAPTATIDEASKAETLIRQTTGVASSQKAVMPAEAAMFPLAPAPPLDHNSTSKTIERPALPQTAPPSPPLKTAAPTAGLPSLPPLPPPKVASNPAGSDRQPESAANADQRGKRPQPASKRGQCTEILQRATLGELTEEDRTILKTQCR